MINYGEAGRLVVGRQVGFVFYRPTFLQRSGPTLLALMMVHSRDPQKYRRQHRKD